MPDVEDEREKSACSALPHMYCNETERRCNLVGVRYNGYIVTIVTMRHLLSAHCLVYHAKAHVERKRGLLYTQLRPAQYFSPFGKKASLLHSLILWIRYPLLATHRIIHFRRQRKPLAHPACPPA